MPDIQTALKSALSKTLQQWDDDEESPPPLPLQPVSTSVSAPSQNIQGNPPTMTKNLFPIRNNVTRETFNYVKDNPGSTRREILTALEHQGFKKGSTTSLLSQLLKTKQIHTTNGLHYADVTEYIPIKGIKVHKKVKPVVVEVKPKRQHTKQATTGIGALLQAKIEAAPAPSREALDAAAYAMGGQRDDRQFLTKLVRTKSPESIVDNLTVYQARELYLHLKQLFGG